jgi:hypothetical protein
MKAYMETRSIAPLILKLSTSGTLATLTPWTVFLVSSEQEVEWAPELDWMLSRRERSRAAITNQTTDHPTCSLKIC